MIMLRRTHDEVVTNFVEMIKDKNEELARVKSDLAAANKTNDILHNRNTELNVRLTVARKKLEVRDKTIEELEQELRECKEYADSIRAKKDNLSKRLKRTMNERDQLEDANHELHQDIQVANAKVEQYKVGNTALGQLYNDANRKLWCNEEGKRQLRNLALAIRDSEKINKTYVAGYLDQIAVRMGGGEKIEFIAVESQK